MPDRDRLRSLLREHWKIAATAPQLVRRGLMSQVWTVTASVDSYVIRLVEVSARARLEIGLAATGQLRRAGIEVGEPVRTLVGGRTVTLGRWAVAVVRRAPGRPLAADDPVDQQCWGDRLGAVHRTLQGFGRTGPGSTWPRLDPDAPYLAADPGLRQAVAAAAGAATRLTVTDQLTYGVLHGDPAPADFVLDPVTGRAGVLDGGAGGTGPLAYDVAVAVAYAGGHDRATDLLDGYLAAGPLERTELQAALPILLRLHQAARAAALARALADGEDVGEALRQARVALRSCSGVG